ncbi:MAG: iron-containing alcohol dehydrogenase [Actinobacteria bacterium]|nr:iron-containing alcohol dehydrogenase [Actinomycetota bacterium]
MNFECFLPVRVIFGNGKINELPNYAGKTGRKALITTSLKRLEILDNVLKILDTCNIKYVLFEDVKANPTSTLINKASEIFKKEKCDYLIGIGGGSSMDFAKAVAIRASHPEDIWNYVYVPYRENLQVTNSTYPVIAVTTTSGTGSEVTKWAVVSNPVTYEKSFLESEYIIPKVAIVDPELTLGLPKQLTAATGMDALSHAIESYTNVNATPFSDITAESCIKIISRYLPEAVVNGTNIYAREKMSWANTLAGITIEHSGTTLVHAMGHVLGGRLNIDHGIAMALCLEPVIRYSWMSNIEKFAKLTEFLGVDTSSFTKKEAAKMASEVVKGLLIDVGLDIKLSALGVKKDMISVFVEDAFRYLTPMLDASPRKPSKNDVIELYMSIM